MGRFVIVAFTPKPGKDDQLLEIVRKHHAILRRQNLVSERRAYLMRAADGTLVEVFEWKSADAITEAHRNPVVAALWAEFAEACDYRKLESLAECTQLFAEFEPVEL